MDTGEKVIKDIEKNGFSVSVYLNQERIFASSKAGLFPLAEFVVKQSKESKNYKDLIIEKTYYYTPICFLMNSQLAHLR